MKHIAVVEDEDMMREELEAILQRGAVPADHTPPLLLWHRGCGCYPP